MTVWSIIRLKVLPEYKIEVSFADGMTGLGDLRPRLCAAGGVGGRRIVASRLNPGVTALAG
jgi:hypothetical protein